MTFTLDEQARIFTQLIGTRRCYDHNIPKPELDAMMHRLGAYQDPTGKWHYQLSEHHELLPPDAIWKGWLLRNHENIVHD